MKPTILIALATALLCATGCTTEPDSVRMEVSQVTCTATGELSYDVTIRNDSEKAVTITEWDPLCPENNFTFKTDARADAARREAGPLPAAPYTLRPAQSLSAKCKLQVKGREGVHRADIAVKSRPEIAASFDFDLLRDTRKAASPLR